jgi:Fur family transcriptional regulator, ferric uptake regulator
MGSNAPVPRKVPSKEELRFEGFLRGRKLKLTIERMAILNAVFGQDRHFDAEALHANLRAKGGDISRATVYRTLDLLVQCGLVRKDSLGSTHANYEAARDNEHHDHLICLNCGKVIEFFRPDLETLQDEICTENAFKPMHHSLQIFGLCSACKGRADEAQIRDRVAQLRT